MLFRSQPEASADRSDFIFKQAPERFDQAFESDIFGETANVMMALDCRGACVPRFDNVRVDRSLREEGDLSEFFRCVFEDANKRFADRFAFAFGIADAGERVQAADIAMKMMGTALLATHLRMLRTKPLIVSPSPFSSGRKGSSRCSR